MPIVKVTWDELGSRGKHVRQLLQPLTRQPDGPAWQPRSVSGDYIIGTHDGSPPQTNHREWRFATFVPNFRGMYFEK